MYWGENRRERVGIAKNATTTQNGENKRKSKDKEDFVDKSFFMDRNKLYFHFSRIHMHK